MSESDDATKWRERLAAAISAWIAENPPPVAMRSGYADIHGLPDCEGRWMPEGEEKWIVIPNADRMNRPDWLDELLASNGGPA